MKYCSDQLLDNFLLFVDPQQKAMYQLDLGARDDDGLRQIYGIDLETSTNPILVGYDTASKTFYWHDDDPPLSSIKYMTPGVVAEDMSLFTFSRGSFQWIINFICLGLSFGNYLPSYCTNQHLLQVHAVLLLYEFVCMYFQERVWR